MFTLSSPWFLVLLLCCRWSLTSCGDGVILRRSRSARLGLRPACRGAGDRGSDGCRLR